VEVRVLSAALSKLAAKVEFRVSAPRSSSGLGRRPLTAEARVRLPYAVLREPRISRGFRRSEGPVGETCIRDARGVVHVELSGDARGAVREQVPVDSHRGPRVALADRRGQFEGRSTRPRSGSWRPSAGSRAERSAPARPSGRARLDPDEFRAIRKKTCKDGRFVGPSGLGANAQTGSDRVRSL
jgi:hypothetical protein